MYCYASEVPLADKYAFNHSGAIFATLHVPRSSIDAYKSAKPWKDFSDIVKINLPEHTLSYIVDGEPYKAYQIEEGENIAPESYPIKEGYTFSGWSEIPKTMPDHDVIVTGSFIVNKYQITYIIDGEVFATDYVEYGAAVVPPNVEEKEGFTFSGWADVPETMPAHNITIYGNFTSEITEIMMGTQRNMCIYSPNGKKIDKLQKGLNIVVLDDGTIKKIVVR